MAAKSRLGEMLVKEKLITDTQLKTALEFQQSVGGGLSQIIVKLGFIDDDRLTGFLAKKQNLDVVDLDKMFLPENLIKSVPRKIIEEEQIIPIAFSDGVVTIATSDPTDLTALDKIQFTSGYKVEMALATRSSINRALNRLFYSAEGKPKKAEEKSKAELLRDLSEKPQEIRAPSKDLVDKLSPMDLRKALIPLLIEKKIITEDELKRKARELAAKGGSD